MMMNSFKFSVLMSVYCKDNPAWFRQAIQSVLNQSVRPEEVVLTADGPLTEELEAIITEFKDKLKVVRLEKNSGRGAALGYAVPQCKYNLIALMDADDVCRKDRFEKQLAAFASNPDLSIVGGQIQEVDSETLFPITLRKVPLTHIEIYKYVKTRMPFNNQTLMFKKSAVLDSGNFKPFHLLEDYYMWARVIAKGYKTANLPDVLVDMRVSPAMYERRGGWKYFLSNKKLFDEMRKLGLLNLWEYYYTLTIRFGVQVLMPNYLRNMFYQKALR